MFEGAYAIHLSASRDPLKPEQALVLYKDELSDYERQEILDYDEIWHVGLNAIKIMAHPDREFNNYGYDTRNNRYITVLGDHIAYRYEFHGLLGSGSFGEVLKVYDHRDKELVAMKILKNVLGIKSQAVKEVSILKKLNNKDKLDHHCIVRMKDFVCFRQHCCITFELLGQDLYRVLEQNIFGGLVMDEIRRVAVSVLHCLQFIHREQIIHCDLKPENIMMPIREPGSIKVIDFSCSCYLDRQRFDYLQTRYYRAPEILLGIPYSTPIDMWSLGCVLAEIHTGVPLFPGTNEKEQLAYIMEVFSKPPDMVLNKAKRRAYYFDPRGNPRPVPTFGDKKCLAGAKNLYQVVRTRNREFLNFLQECLHWDANMRMTAKQALNHDWIKETNKSGCPFKYLRR